MNVMNILTIFVGMKSFFKDQLISKDFILHFTQVQKKAG